MTPKVIFKFDKEKDAYNIFRAYNSPKWYGHDFSKKLPKEVKNICKKDFQKCKIVLNGLKRME